VNRRTFLQHVAGTAFVALGCANRSQEMPRDMTRRLRSIIQGWDAIPDHRTGTSGDAETAEWLARQVRAAGVEPVMQAFPFRRRVPGDCFLEVAGRRIPGVPLFDGGAGEGIRAKLGMPGGIAVQPFAPFGAHPDTQRLNELRTAHGHAGIVALAKGDLVKPGLALLNADDWKEPFGPPVLQVATEHAELLFAARDRGSEAVMHAPFALEETTATNVQATVPGRDPSLAPLVVMTPRSAWWTCTAERSGGIAIWLEALGMLAADAPDRTVLFTANTGHELGHVGLDAFLEEHMELVAGAHGWVHLGANFAAADGTVRFQASSQEWVDLAEQAFAEQGAERDQLTPLGTRPLGEARNIHDGGGSFVSLLGMTAWFHHPDDRWPESIDLAKTERLTRALLDVIRSLASA
jgi:hypothetical protein